MTKPLPEYPFYEGVEGTIPVAHGADSLVALDRVSGLGYTHVEVNVVATKDGIPINFHGSRTARQALKTGIPAIREIEDMTFAEARDALSVDDEPIVPLEEAMTTYPGLRFFVDLKAPKAIAPVAQLIRRLALHDRISVGGSNDAYANAVREEVRDSGFICTSLGTAGSLAFLFTRMRLQAAERYVRESEATEFVLPFLPVVSTTAARAHERGKRVFVWTPNELDQITGSLGKGVDGIMSDNFGLLKQLTDHGMLAR